MTDEEWKAEIAKIEDPIEMLEAIIENQDFLGYDPYFKDLRQAMLDQVEIIIAKAKEQTQ